MKTKTKRRGRPAGGPGPEAPKSWLADKLADLDEMIEDGCAGNVETANSTDLSVFINNCGSNRDRAAALLALLPIARRLFDRKDEHDSWRKVYLRQVAAWEAERAKKLIEEEKAKAKKKR